MIDLMRRYYKKYIGVKYRIVRDKFAGYEAQYRILGFIWEQMDYINTHDTIEEALEFIYEKTGKRMFFNGIGEVLSELDLNFDK